MSEDTQHKDSDARPFQKVPFCDDIVSFPKTEISVTAGQFFVNPAFLADGVTSSAPPMSNLTGNEYLSAKQIATLLHLPYDKLRKRLERFRESPSGYRSFIKNEETKAGQPQYVYQLNAVIDEIRAIQIGKNVHRAKNFDETDDRTPPLRPVR